MAERPAKIRAIRGVKDVLPSEVHLWQRVEETARELFHRYGFREIRIPIFEKTELFARGIGEGTDIVAKEMYSFEDKGGERITLRPEATASICRAYVEHRLFDLPGLAKLYCLGPMFRYERPQAGRYRQFYQLNAEAFGTEDPSLDAEVLTLVWELFGALGIGGLTLVLNSLGCPRCRPAHGESLRAYLQGQREALCEDCRRRAEVNPLRALDCKNKSCRPILDRAPSVEDFWCEECRAHLEALRGMLKRGGVP
ncbi:MAG: histidine--tRNA ligase, partial [Nitrospinota bacterium]